MLNLAYSRKEEIQKLYLKCLSEGHLDDMFHCSWVNFELKIDDSNWNSLQMVSVGENDRVIGYIAASIDRASEKVNELVEFCDEGLSENDMLTYLTDRAALIDMLLVRFKFRKIEFTCLAGSKTDKLNSRLDGRFGLRKVGTRLKSVRVLDGTYRDRVYYEIINENYDEQKA